jgi:hypothetical protein
VLPDACALDHVALLHLRLGRRGLLLRSVTASGSKLGLEVVLDLLLARLLLLLERGEVALGLVLLALLLLGRLLLLLWGVLTVTVPAGVGMLTFLARSANISVTSSTSLSSAHHVSHVCGIAGGLTLGQAVALSRGLTAVGL